MPNVPNHTRPGARTVYEPVVAPTTRYAGREAAAAVLFAVAALLYNWWLLEFVLHTGLDPRNSYVSELYAADQPLRRLFGALEAGCALLVIAGALLARSTPSGHGRWARTGWLALVGLGLSSLADVLLPMACAPSVERGCLAVHPWHTATSAFAHFFLFASMAFLSRAAAVQRPPMPAVRRWGPRVLAVAMPAAILTVGPLIGHPGWHGVPQRVHLALVGVWFLLLAGALGRSARRRRRWAGHWDGPWARYVEGLRRACHNTPPGHEDAPPAGDEKRTLAHHENGSTTGRETDLAPTPEPSATEQVTTEQSTTQQGAPRLSAAGQGTSEVGVPKGLPEAGVPEATASEAVDQRPGGPEVAAGEPGGPGLGARGPGAPEPGARGATNAPQEAREPGAPGPGAPGTAIQEPGTSGEAGSEPAGPE
ncbi:DUF998 domain-containing protein [Streptomyces sp. MspMP-M5]|uniref:DUF998 domain-containing protein n=1 Tax=unclassified Streptomyces TaxID=2593676 RepID=UPI000364172E|nr:DUF998 domain-containing protein [Streptomyces sp. MspMP-M5]